MSALVKSPGAVQLGHPDVFADRHIGPSQGDVDAMLKTLGFSSLDALADAVVPAKIWTQRALDLPEPAGETQALAELRLQRPPDAAPEPAHGFPGPATWIKSKERRVTVKVMARRMQFPGGE